MSTQKNGLSSKTTKSKSRHISITAISNARTNVRASVKKAAKNISSRLNLPKVAKKYFDIKRIVFPKKPVSLKKKVSAKKIIASAKPKITKEQLINDESALGGQLFGPVPKGHQREFFLYHHNYWIYYETWYEGGHKKESAITFEVRKNGVYKNPLGSGYRKISGAELQNFCHAAREYRRLVKAKLYQK